MIEEDHRVLKCPSCGKIAIIPITILLSGDEHIVMMTCDECIINQRKNKKWLIDVVAVL